MESRACTALNRKSSIERFNELYQTLAENESKRRKREVALKQETAKHVKLIQAKSKLMSAKSEKKQPLKCSRS
jgi:hypothetical protein